MFVVSLFSITSIIRSRNNTMLINSYVKYLMIHKDMKPFTKATIEV